MAFHILRLWLKQCVTLIISRSILVKKFSLAKHLDYHVLLILPICDFQKPSTEKQQDSSDNRTWKIVQSRNSWLTEAWSSSETDKGQWSCQQPQPQRAPTHSPQSQCASTSQICPASYQSVICFPSSRELMLLTLAMRTSHAVWGRGRDAWVCSSFSHLFCVTFKKADLWCITLGLSSLFEAQRSGCEPHF